MIFPGEAGRALLLTGLLLSVAACTSTPGSAHTEQLLASPPPDWTLVYQLNNVTSRLSDFIPPGESENEWTTKLSFESFTGLKGADPIETLLSEVTSDEQNCSFVQHFNLYSGLENGYPASVRLYFCGENLLTGKGEVKLVKAIGGNEYFYLVRILKVIEPFQINEPDMAKEEIAEWSSYLRKIVLCDPQSAAQAC